MSSRRTEKVASVIRETVSSTILFELRDPRIANVTVTRVEVSADLQVAKIYVSVMGDERAQSLCMHGLNSARGFLQSKVADRVKTRYTPTLRFVLDDGIKKSFEVARLIREVLPQEEAGGEGAAGDGVDPDGVESDVTEAPGPALHTADDSADGDTEDTEPDD